MIEKWFEPFMLLVRLPASDGLGARPASLTDDRAFQGVLTFTAAKEIPAGGQPVLEDTPTLLYDPDVTLAPGDLIRREKDGAVYRVCSSALQAPARSALRFSQAKVERQVIPC